MGRIWSWNTEDLELGVEMLTIVSIRCLHWLLFLNGGMSRTPLAACNGLVAKKCSRLCESDATITAEPDSI